MKSSRLAMASAVAMLGGLALAVPVAGVAAPHPGETVRLKSRISIDSNASAGRVRSSNENCTEERQVVIKEKGVGRIGSAMTDPNGAWKAQPNYQGAPPFRVYAEVKPSGQGTAGTFYKCLAAKSRTVEVRP